MRITIVEVKDIIDKISKNNRTDIGSVLSRFDEFTILIFILINKNISGIDHENSDNENYYRYVPDGTYNMSNLRYKEYFSDKVFPYIYGEELNSEYNYYEKENKIRYLYIEFLYRKYLLIELKKLQLQYMADEIIKGVTEYNLNKPTRISKYNFNKKFFNYCNNDKTLIENYKKIQFIINDHFKFTISKIIESDNNDEIIGRLLLIETNLQNDPNILNNILIIWDAYCRNKYLVYKTKYLKLKYNNIL
jgi:hypothetical protein